MPADAALLRHRYNDESIRTSGLMLGALPPGIVAALFSKEIEIVDELPMTTTGKLQRRILRLLKQERAQNNLRQEEKSE